MDDSYLNDDFEPSSEKNTYLEEANQSAIKEIHRLQLLVEDKESTVADLSKLNSALLEQLEEKVSIISDMDGRSSDTSMVEYLEETNQSALKKIDRLQNLLSDKQSILDDVGQLSQALMNQVEEKNKLLSDLEQKVFEIEQEREQWLIRKTEWSAQHQRQEEGHYTEKLKASITISEKQIAILRKVIVAKQHSN